MSPGLERQQINQDEESRHFFHENAKSEILNDTHSIRFQRFTVYLFGVRDFL
jgi:hypothetical protein